MKDLKTQSYLVNEFAKSMKIELKQNAYKGDWRNWDNVTEQLEELDYHITKLKSAIKLYEDSNRNNMHFELLVRELLADCGNILLMTGNSYNLY